MAMAWRASRTLHWVFKVADRSSTVAFLEQVLGMHVLRHEEFDERCEAACNGPYDGKWSKTMMGYGAEDEHFVLELTYNYGVKHYRVGNDFRSIAVSSRTAFERAIAHGTVHDVQERRVSVRSPDGYVFVVLDEDVEDGKPVREIALNVTQLDRSVPYWNQMLGMDLVERTQNEATLRYGSDTCLLRLVELAPRVVLDHAEAYGRIAFACPTDALPKLQAHLQAHQHEILKEWVALETPGKANVHVVIAADPDGYEICYVGDEAFRELSKRDPEAPSLLRDAMEKDGSNAWFAKKAARA